MTHVEGIAKYIRGSGERHAMVSVDGPARDPSVGVILRRFWVARRSTVIYQTVEQTVSRPAEKWLTRRPLRYERYRIFTAASHYRSASYVLLGVATSTRLGTNTRFVCLVVEKELRLPFHKCIHAMR